jgi:glycosyltransferase involved in cell wall biosynthesis
VAIPALDEEATIGAVIAAIPERIDGISRIDVVVVDDGSTDRTGAIARELGAAVVRHPVPGGVGSAFHAALGHLVESGADLLVTLDGDGQFDPSEIAAVVAPVLSGDADLAIGSRFKDPALTPTMPALNRWGNKLVSHIISGLIGQRFHDVSCGMRCYSRRAAQSLHVIGRFTYTQEVILSLAVKRLVIAEVPIRVRGVRPHGKSRVARSVFAYAWRAGKIILRAYRDYFPLRFFGALALGLLGPALCLGTFLLAHYLRTGTLSPHKWAGAISGVLLVLAVLSAQLGVVGDMLNRHRLYMEELLYHARERRG